ncbi:glycosyltransferase family 39 protein [Bdellovibrio sp. KM01]|uniref:ArnT family glycosyltransferase n=1 Tax=Bdellovibrio sp. KM01 TaxID=2748865 RepID=UPI0015E9B884|nr:glycosyltransferase family 39 protein [Bdellovibrio sp. KM01]QLY27023.1 glycosyltransferase family 39 protein [Bdellovibrio sp. KM01]
MTESKNSLRTFLYIVTGVFLLVFAKNWEPGIGVSSTTYGALAKNILSTGNLFHFNLGPGLYDPFVDHPPLALWLDALVFKFFGISAQTIRLVSSISGILAIAAMFGAVKNLSNERHAVFTYLIIIPVTTFFNFMASGWLDMPMVAFTLGGFYFATLAERKNRSLCVFLAGLSLSCAVLTKGAGALGTIPVGLFILIYNFKTPKALASFAVGILAPLSLFTFFHYQQEGFIFWSAYLKRQFGQNVVQQSAHEPFWYFRATWERAAILLLLFPFAIRKLWQDQRPLCILILGQLLIHIAVYSTSARHYDQYTLPIYPWLAITAGYFLATKFANANSLKISKVLASIALFFFVAVDLLPIRVHSGNEVPFRAFMPAMGSFSKVQEIYFPSTIEDQDMWEITGSFISWYLDKTPVRVEPSQFKETLRQHPEVLAIVETKAFNELSFKKEDGDIHHKCLWNEELILLATEEQCPSSVQSYRPIEAKKQTFTR